MQRNAEDPSQAKKHRQIGSTPFTRTTKTLQVSKGAMDWKPTRLGSYTRRLLGVVFEASKVCQRISTSEAMPSRLPKAGHVPGNLPAFTGLGHSLVAGNQAVFHVDGLSICPCTKP
jgi:hypothetical protein